MRTLIRNFVKICSETLPIKEPIYEFGSFQVPGQTEFADLRPFFPHKKYVGTDMREGPGVDLVVDIQNISLPHESVGTVISVDTLEHVEDPRRAMEGIYKIVKPNGLAIITSTMSINIHDYPYDYWRFTPEAFKSLLHPFKTVFVGYSGESRLPHTIVGIGYKGDLDFNAFEARYNIWKEDWNNPLKTTDIQSWKGMSRVIVPPLFIYLAKKALKRQY